MIADATADLAMSEESAMRVARRVLQREVPPEVIDQGRDPGELVLDGFLRTCTHGKVIDVELAIEAALLDPRPAWVELHLGPLPKIEDDA